MLAKAAAELPPGEGFLFEPKWDGLRALVFREADSAHLQGRDGKPLDRNFPELVRALSDALPKGCVLDGEIVIRGPSGLNHDALQKRIHFSDSLISHLAKVTPASFIAFDLLAAGGRSVMPLPQAERRVRLERLIADARPPLHLTPMTRDRTIAADWLHRFKGAGFDGVMAKSEEQPYRPGKRTLFKVKLEKAADCAVMGFRWHQGRDDEIGTLSLGLFDDAGVLQPAGVASSFPLEMRRQLLAELLPLRENAPAPEPSGEQAAPWQPLRPERVCEVKYLHFAGGKFREPTTFVRWRLDKPPQECRCDQLEVATPLELSQVFTKLGKSM
jgi:ATP-dependent DNA ligase